MGPSQEIVLSASQGARVGVAALVVWALVALLKSSLVPIDFAPRSRPYLALLLGQAYTMLEAIVLGTPWGMAVVLGVVATTTAIGGQELGSAAKTSSPPPGAVGVLLVLALGGAASGCGAAQSFEQLAHASRDVLVVAEPCMVAAKQLEEAKCDGHPACVADVKARWRPVADALDRVHFYWCELTPQSEGC